MIPTSPHSQTKLMCRRSRRLRNEILTTVSRLCHNALDSWAKISSLKSCVTPPHVSGQCDTKRPKRHKKQQQTNKQTKEQQQQNTQTRTSTATVCFTCTLTASLTWWLRRPTLERKIRGSNPACVGIFPETR